MTKKGHFSYLVDLTNYLITRLYKKLIRKISNHNKWLNSSVKWEFEDSMYAYL